MHFHVFAFELNKIYVLFAFSSVLPKNCKSVLLTEPILQIYYFLEYYKKKPLNMITLGQTTSDNINRIITLSH